MPTIPAIDKIMGGLEKLRDITESTFPQVKNAYNSDGKAPGPVTYPLSPDFIKTFAHAGLPFLTFYEFNDLVGWCRDVYFAPDHVAGYKEDIGKKYTIWTRDTISAYRRHIIFDSLANDVTISFEIPYLNTASWFPLRICLYDCAGLYFQQDQKLVVERLTEGYPRLSSWKKIPKLKNTLPCLHARSSHKLNAGPSSFAYKTDPLL